jgi:HK97 gp10 family phage protein
MTGRVEGIDALLRTFQRLTNSVPEAVQQQALEEGAEIIAREARRLVPVGSGNLRDSIVVSGRALGGAFKMDNSIEGGGVTVYVGPRTGGGGPDGFYGHMVEFGTINMAAHPFMRPAIDNTRAEVQRRIGDELWAPIEKAARG